MNVDRELVLRQAQAFEATAIARMSRLQVEYGLRWRWTTERVRRCILDAETIVLVATCEGVIAGFAIMRFGDEVAHLLLLAVDSRYQRQGLGSRMTAWLEKSCRTAGIRRIRLEVRDSNQPARLFYESLGFSVTGVIEQYYSRTESALVMSRALISD